MTLPLWQRFANLSPEVRQAHRDEMIAYGRRIIRPAKPEDRLSRWRREAIMNAQPPTLNDTYHALIDKHGGFWWRSAGSSGGAEDLCFWSDEARDAFIKEWRAMGGWAAIAPEPEPIDENDYDLAHLRGTL